MSAERSLTELRAWLAAAPPGTLVNTQELARALTAVSADVSSPPPAPALSWRERLWTAPPETRIGVAELCEALGRTKSWVWRHTGPHSPGARIPHRKLDGELVFVVGEIRQYVLTHEQVVVAGGGSLVVTRTRRPA